MMRCPRPFSASRRSPRPWEGALREIGRHGDDPEFRERLRHAMTEYGITRNAAAEITTGLLNLGAGALTLTS